MIIDDMMGKLYWRGLVMVDSFVFVFFFQAEDGIRDVAVTGVQTCALPISTLPDETQSRLEALYAFRDTALHNGYEWSKATSAQFETRIRNSQCEAWFNVAIEIGRASCRERV